MKEIILKIISSGTTGNLSSKRVVVLLAALTIIISAYLNLFYKYHIDDNILNSLTLITISGLGLVASEPYVDKLKDKLLNHQNGD